MSNSLHFFTIPALAPAAAQETLNQFLAQHRVVTMEKQWLAAGADSHWVICVTVAAGQAALPNALKLDAKAGRHDQLPFSRAKAA
jgi:hypothetical protein